MKQPILKGNVLLKSVASLINQKGVTIAYYLKIQEPCPRDINNGSIQWDYVIENEGNFYFEPIQK